MALLCLATVERQYGAWPEFGQAVGLSRQSILNTDATRVYGSPLYTLPVARSPIAFVNEHVDYYVASASRPDSASRMTCSGNRVWKEVLDGPSYPVFYPI